MGAATLSERLSAIQNARDQELAAKAKKAEAEKAARERVIGQLERIFPNQDLGTKGVDAIIAGRPGKLTITALQGQERYYRVATEIGTQRTQLLSVKSGRALGPDLEYPDSEYLDEMSHILSEAAEILGIPPSPSGNPTSNGIRMQKA